MSTANREFGVETSNRHCFTKRPCKSGEKSNYSARSVYLWLSNIGERVMPFSKKMRHFVNALLIALPILIFFLFNTLTPFWWDDFVMACSFDRWHEPHIRMMENFNDIIVSTCNMYNNWHGRSVADFFNFLFMFFKEKTIFNICNTVVYTLCVFLMCFHITGSIKKISPMLFVCVNIFLWLFVPAWGQNLLWLTGSCNYLWTTFNILVFLIPFRKQTNNPTYKPHASISFGWFFIGILAGWSMENSASGIFVLLIAYFIAKKIQKTRLALFEIMGTVGFMAGFFMLLQARHSLLPDFGILVANIIRVSFHFLMIDGFLFALIIIAGVELVVFKKQKLPKAIYGYCIIAIGSILAMVIPIGFEKRAVFITQVFLIIVVLSLYMETLRYLPKRSFFYCFLTVFLLFLPSFYQGTKSILESSLFSAAREQYILDEKKKGNTNIKVKTPIPVADTHSGLYGGIDILSDPNNIQYITHNSAKATWYGIHSLDGVSTVDNPNRMNEFDAIIELYKRDRKAKHLKPTDLFKMIYDAW